MLYRILNSSSSFGHFLCFNRTERTRLLGNSSSDTLPSIKEFYAWLNDNVGPEVDDDQEGNWQIRILDQNLYHLDIPSHYEYHSQLYKGLVFKRADDAMLTKLIWDDKSRCS